MLTEDAGKRGAMGLDDAFRRVEDVHRAQRDQRGSDAAETATVLTGLQQEIDELTAETYEWLQRNPRPQTILGYAQLEYSDPAAPKRYTIAHEFSVRDPFDD